MKNTLQDVGSLRKYIHASLFQKIASNKGEDFKEKKDAIKRREQMIQNRKEALTTLKPIGTGDPDYIPFYDLPKNERDSDRNVSSTDINRFNKQYDIIKNDQENNMIVKKTREVRSFVDALHTYIITTLTFIHKFYLWIG